jgi:hypothetical protein
MDFQSMTPMLRCDHCDDVIGVYEPAVIVLSDQARLTSRAAEPSLIFEPGERYHRSCYLERSGRAV